MSKTPHVVLCTCPDHATALEIAELLVDKKVAACVNVIPKLQSFYRWQGKVESIEEHLLIIKSCVENYVKLETLIRSNHPHKVPEIIALPIKRGSLEYLSWLTENVAVE